MTALTVSDRSVYADGTPTAPVHIIGVNGTFHVHAAECGDVMRRKIYRAASARNPFGVDPAELTNTYEVRDVRDVVDSVFGPECGSFYTESGWDSATQTEDERNATAWTEYRSEFKFFPCISLPENAGR